MGSSTNARIAFGGLLLLGLADLGLVNFKLAPEYAEEQAKLAQANGPPGKTTAEPTPPRPSVVKSASVPVAEPAPTPEPKASAAPPPAVSATTEPSAVAVEPTPPTPTVEPPPAPPPPQPTTKTEPPPVVASGEKPGAIQDIMFELDSNLLTIASKSTLDDVLAKLKANPSLRVHVRGHSDQLGSREHNLELSRKRAAAVEGFFLASGIARGRVTTEAVGGSKPADPSNTPAAWARNRRVEIEWR